MKIAVQRLFLRATWLKIHLYLALSAGLFFALMGLSGSLSIYREELDSLLNPQLVITAPQDKLQSLDRIIAAVKNAHPQRHGAWTLEMPHTPTGMITAWYDKPQETFFEFHAPLMVSINPYTAEVVANRFWGQTLSTWILDLHTQLQWDKLGWNAVGILGVLLSASVGSGIFLWWPGFRGLLSTFNIRVRAGQRALVFDVHRSIGVLSAGALLVLALTGFSLSYPDILETLTGSSGMGHGETGRVIISTADPTDHPTTLAGAVFVARSAFPKAELRRIVTPVGDTGVYRINFRQASEINQHHPFTTVWVDHWSGQIKAIRDPGNFSSGETLSTWIWPIHTGEALGEKGRFIWFLGGLSLFILYVTGLLLWLFRSGRLQDKAVNVAALQASAYRFRQTSQQVGLILLQQIIRLVTYAIRYAPQIKRVLKPIALRLWRWIHRLLQSRKWLDKQ
ncbi:MAG: PepSY-associated TM helix domain-containing protein [Methylococcaceae bacterium]